MGRYEVEYGVGDAFGVVGDLDGYRGVHLVEQVEGHLQKLVPQRRLRARLPLQQAVEAALCRDAHDIRSIGHTHTHTRHRTHACSLRTVG
jgi:hypothetical protein